MSEGLHELDPTKRFADRVAEYVRYRPSYPAAIIDAVLEDLGDAANLNAADVGAGTGISARLLADRGVRVQAIEPNLAMREGAQAHPKVQWRDGTAERTGLDSGSVDLVLCAQAFHWFRKAEALAELGRVLRAGGRLAVMWNLGSPDDPAVRAYYDVVFNASKEARRIGREREYVDPFEGQMRWIRERVVRADFEESYDLEGLIGRAMSASYVPKEGEESRRVRERLGEVFASHQRAGRISMTYRTTLYRARSA